MNIDLYLPRPSWVHRVEPRVKLLFTASFLLLLILYKNLYFMVAATLFVHAIHWAAQMPRQKFLFVWKTLLPVSLLMFALRTLFYPVGDPIFQLWIIKITPIALAQGGVLALRLIGMAFAVFAWLYTTELTTLVNSLVQLKMPYHWGLTLALALRYIPTFQGSYTMISQAQQARGLALSTEKGFRRVRLMMPIFVAMIISSLKASNQLGMALEARGLGNALRESGIPRTSLHESHLRPFDITLIALIFTITIVLIYANLAFGFGVQPIDLITQYLPLPIYPPPL